MWFPCVKLGTVTEAVPLDSRTLPNDVVPSKKLIIPVAVFGVIDAVKVTAWQGEDGFSELVSERVVVVSVTICETELEQIMPPAAALNAMG
jgi:hypothetical protein